MPSAAVAAQLPTTRRREDLACRHCGDPCGDSAEVHVDGPFCCSGCASVFAVLHDRGLDAYYACDIQPGVSQRSHRAPHADQFASLDDEQTASLFLVTWSARDARAILRLPDLHCASCVWLLEQLWRVAPGVARSEVDLMQRTIRVDFDPATTSLRRIAEALASLGYEPSLDAVAGTRAAGPRRTLLLKIGMAGFAFGNVMLFSIPQYLTGDPLESPFRELFDGLNLILSLSVLLYSASDYFRGAWTALQGRGLTLDVPVALGLTAMFVRSTADIVSRTGTGYFDSFTGLVFFLLIGKLFQQKAFEAIAFDRDVRSFLPLHARVEREGLATSRPIQDIVAGDVIHVRPGEVVPADSMLIDPSATIDQSFITGESQPVEATRGEVVRAGGRVTGCSIRVNALRPASQGTLAELWAHPIVQRVKPHWLTTVAARFGSGFTVIAIGLALAGALAWWPDVRLSLQVATAVLIIACPCAMTLAAPITLGTAAGVLGRAGCFLKSPAVALDLSRIDHVVFDKTGTLTAADHALAVEYEGLGPADRERVRALATHSTHPISRAVASVDAATSIVHDVSGAREHAGQGLTGRVDGHHVAIGRADFVAAQTDRPPATLASDDADHWTAVAVDGRLGRLRVTQTKREGVDGMLDQLARRFTLSLLSGDRRGSGGSWQRWFSRETFEQSPADKLGAVRRYQEGGDHVLMVGDGLNDTGAFAAADVGMAVSDDTACLVPACDAVIQGTALGALPVLLAYTRRARRVIVFCFAVSVIYNILGLTLALRGDLTPLVTAILMPVSSLTIIGLSVGLMRWKAPRRIPV